MEKTLIIRKGDTEIEFFDLDKEKEIMVSMHNSFRDTADYITLNKEDLISLRKHIDYLLEKM